MIFLCLFIQRKKMDKIREKIMEDLNKIREKEKEDLNKIREKEKKEIDKEMKIKEILKEYICDDVSSLIVEYARSMRSLLVDFEKRINKLEVTYNFKFSSTASKYNYIRLFKASCQKKMIFLCLFIQRKI